MKQAKTSVLFSVLLTIGLAAPASAAQYKWIDDEGKVNYGDRPPTTQVRMLASPGKGNSVSAAPPSADSVLPLSLKTAAARFPVVLYTGRDCAPCGAARAHLSKRGIPFVEKTISSEADAAAFRKLAFSEMTVPAVSVGRERLSGFEPGAWDGLLDAGGYPKASLLPPDFKGPSPEALSGEKTGPGGRVIERFVKQERPPAAAEIQAPPLLTSPSSIRF
jgi:glutaredoxin